MAARLFLIGLILGMVLVERTLPLTHDNAWLANTLAVAGVAAVWLGLWRRWSLVWRAGLLMEASAWLAFMAATNGLDIATALQARLWLRFLILAAGSLALALTFHIQPAGPAAARMPALAPIFLASSAMWLLAGAWTEIVLRRQGIGELNLLTASALLIAALFAILARRLHWNAAGHTALALQFVAAGVWLVFIRSRWSAQSAGLLEGPFPSAAMLALGLFLCNRLLGQRDETTSAPHLSGLVGFVLPWIGLCWTTLSLGLLLNWATTTYAAPSGAQAEKAAPGASGGMARILFPQGDTNEAK
ncbi:MAG: hypothetical protein H7Z39_03950 [Burkholderiaceae bacterium]|nr:hypothetical protein [Burkholderiaceae bacterium]